MSLTKYKLGELIEISTEQNYNLAYDISAVKGISTQKIFIETKADMTGISLKNYKLVKPKYFAYVPDTSRRGNKISLGFNNTKQTFLVSSISIIFKVKRTNILLSDYLFIYFNRNEFDRYSRFNSWGSARETFSWNDMCDIEISLPSIDIQQKYVNIYKAMIANQHSYEKGLDDLKIVFEGYLDNLKKKYPLETIGKYLIENNNRNTIGLSLKQVRGLSTNKELIQTKADMNGVNLKNYKLVEPRQIAYVPDTSRRGDKISLGFNNTDEIFLVSSISIVFGTKHEKLLPEFLMLFFFRKEFDRYARFNSWGSARETFDFSSMCDVKIPIPDLKIQKAISDIYKVYTIRKNIKERLNSQIKDICPILIKGSIEEALK